MTARPSDSSFATVSFDAMRPATSPRLRWLKNCIGRLTTCQTKRTDATMASLAAMRASIVRCSQISAPWPRARAASPSSTGPTQALFPCMRTSSTKTRMRVASARPGTTMASVASTAKARGRRASLKRARRPAARFRGRPPGRKSGPGWKAKHTPEKLSSNSSSGIRAGPDAGSLM